MTASTTERTRSAPLIERSLRFWSGTVLMVYVAMHLSNHAIGVFGIDTMTRVQHWRLAIWGHAFSAVVLYGAVILHMATSLDRAVFRKTWRMPAYEAAQIASGLLIPWLALDHVLATRAVANFAEFDISYINVLRNLWPGGALKQIIFLTIVWTHGCIGLNYGLAAYRWYQRQRTLFLAIAVLIPALAIAGFISAGREAQTYPQPRVEKSQRFKEVIDSGQTIGIGVLGTLFAGLAAALLIGVAIRRQGQKVHIRYAGYGVIESPKGPTLLEISRANHIPHASTCGGRGRCTTCRVLINSNVEKLPPPNAIEESVLARIRAPVNVRLACQIHPTEDISVRMLLPAHIEKPTPFGTNKAMIADGQREVTILIADMRGLSSHVAFQSASDVTLLLNRLVGQMIEVVEMHHGIVSSIETDGVLAIFGADGGPDSGARSAVEAAVSLLRVADRITREVGPAAPAPIRLGVGVHTGSVLIARIGDDEHGYRVAPIGTTVIITDRLQEGTKEYSSDCIISADTLKAARLQPKTGRAVSMFYKNADHAVSAYAYPTRRELAALMKRGAGFPNEENEAARETAAPASPAQEAQ